jgi:PAS domain-containing protein
MEHHDHAKHHAEILQGAVEHFLEVLENSSQAMYIFLDDENVFFNERLLTMLGYASSKEALADGPSMLMKLVHEKSRPVLVGAYQRAMEKMAGSTIPITWLAKSGKKVETTVILVPIVYDNHLLALHFIEPAKPQ